MVDSERIGMLKPATFIDVMENIIGSRSIKYFLEGSSEKGAAPRISTCTARGVLQTPHSGTFEACAKVWEINTFLENNH